MHLSFEGKVVAVTGAAQGIGAAIARRFAASGAQVAALDIDTDGMAPLGAEGMSLHAADLGSRDDCSVEIPIFEKIFRRPPLIALR